MKKINVIDIAVTISIIALVFVAYLKFGVYEHTKTDSEMTKIQYSIKVSGVRDYTANAFVVGDDVYDSQTKLKIGTITNVEKEKARINVETSNGKVANGESKVKNDVTVTIVTDGLETDKAYFADRSVELKVGSEKNFETLYVKTMGTIVDIKVIE